jgi:hypothetical protein
MADQDSSGIELLNIAPGKKMKFKTIAKPDKTNPYIEPSVFKDNYMDRPFQREPPGRRDENYRRETNDIAVIPVPGAPRQGAPEDRPLYTNYDEDAGQYNTQRKGTPERQSLLKETPSANNSFVKGSPDKENIFDDEEEPDNYAIFHDDMEKIKRFKEDYNNAFEKDKEIDRKITVQQVKLDQLVEHSNQLVDKKEEFKQTLMELMKENARLEHRNDELLEDIKELEEAIEKGIKLVNEDDDEDEKNLNLFMVGDPTKLHEMKIERERRKLKRALINALDYMEGKESRLTGIKEHQTQWQK